MRSESGREPSAASAPDAPRAVPAPRATQAGSPESSAHAPAHAPAPAPDARTWLRGVAGRVDGAAVRGLVRVTGSALGPYQTATVRIGFAFTWLFFLLFEWPHRRELYGPDGPWSWELAERLIAGNHAFTVLMWSDSVVWFEAVYLLALLSSAALLVGWRTRTMSVLFMIGVLSLQNRSVFMGDGGDNVIHLMAMYLVFTRCGQVWSLDARRARRARRDPGAVDTDLIGIALWSVLGGALLLVTVRGELSWFGDEGPVPFVGWSSVLWALWAAYGLWWYARLRAGELHRLLDVLGNLAHNTALLVIIVEVCLIYATAGWYKIQGSRWQDGTAVYYPLNLDYFAPWPALSQVLGGSALMIMLLTYGTVIVQVAFPFTLFNRRVKNVLLAVMMLEHASIAVILGLPFFSLAMIAADAVFLPTVFLVWLGARATGLGERLRARLRKPDRRGGTQERAGADGPARTLVG